METHALAPGYREPKPLSPTPLRVSIESFRRLGESPDPLEKEKSQFEQLLSSNIPITAEELHKLLILFPESEKVQLCNAICWERFQDVIDIIERRYAFTVPSLYFAHNFIYNKCGNLYAKIMGKYVKGYSKKLNVIHYDFICKALEKEGAITTYAMYEPRTPKIQRPRAETV